MTDPVIAAKLREVEEILNELCPYKHSLQLFTLDGKRLPCDWLLHRLVRKLATVCQERMRERAQVYLVHKILDDGIAEELDVDGKPIDTGIAALPLEGEDG